MPGKDLGVRSGNQPGDRALPSAIRVLLGRCFVSHLCIPSPRLDVWIFRGTFSLASFESCSGCESVYSTVARLIHSVFTRYDPTSCRIFLLEATVLGSIESFDSILRSIVQYNIGEIRLYHSMVHAEVFSNA